MADEMFTMENQCVTVAVNQAGRYNQFQCAGKVVTICDHLLNLEITICDFKWSALVQLKRS